jgi:putative serine protease PepD
MTTTYDPFTPAGASEQPGYGGRRRTEERGWSDEPVQIPEQRWGEERPAATHWTEDPRWDGDDRQESWAPAPSYQAGSYPVGGYAAQPRQGYAEDGYAQGGGYAAAGGYERTGAYPPATEYGSAGGYAATAGGYAATAGGYAAPEPRAERGKPWVRPVIIGLVGLLVVVAGWQAYRIEGVTRDNQTLVSGLTAEKDRTDQLEKQLAGVFDPEAVSTKVLPSVFRVRAGDFTGTAFSVGAKAAGGKANLLTNYHVVAEVYAGGGRSVSLERGNTQIAATIVKVNKAKDLALLQAGQAITPLSAAGSQVKPGQQVVVVGAPLGLDDTVTSGVISAYRPDDPEGPTIQFDAAINPGNSGGPVVNSNNQVVGLATAKAKDAEGIGLAIPIKTACDTFAIC